MKLCDMIMMRGRTKNFNDSTTEARCHTTDAREASCLSVGHESNSDGESMGHYCVEQ